MNTKTIKSVALLIVLILLDQITKLWATQSIADKVVYNSGWIGGSFSETSAVLRVGILLGFYSAIFIFFISFWNHITQASHPIRYPIYFFFAGITGNFIDRVRIGAAIDFIHVELFEKHAVLNVADFYQWIGILYCLITAIFFKNYFNKKDRRNQIFAHQRLQMKIFLKISLVFLGFLASMATLFYLSFRNETDSAQFLSALLWVFLCYGILFETVLFLILLSETQKWIGPVQSFIQYMLPSPKSHAFKLRKQDEFRELEEIAKKTKEKAPSS